MNNIHNILREVFKHESFRPWQEEIIRSVAWWNHTLVFMPTGWGKSLTYQIPAIAREGVCLVISPLISLMKDQIDALRSLNVKAEYINSSIDFAAQQSILNEISKPQSDIRFLYIAPERLNSESFLRVLYSIKISLVAIDEAHCISQWWHDFRPSYMKMKGFIANLHKNQNFPVMALTATATIKVKKDIEERLGLDSCQTFTTGFDRKNIIIIVREISKKEDKLDKTAEIIAKTPGSGIIYCSSRKAVDEVYNYLLEKWVSVGKYTWAMNPHDRESMQNSFMNSETKVIVATNAFWMWIDKKDIRFVIHYNLPWSIENYYQEVWRAWRDGKNSYGIVLASYQDTKIQEFFIESTYPPKKDILSVYDYLYTSTSIFTKKEDEKGELSDADYKWAQVLKTYYDIASWSGVNNDMKVWSAIKIFEKYWILRRWVQDISEEVQFRWRWLTLLQEKRQHSQLLIDWKHQELLENEAYFKLDEIKKLLFYPHCRKRKILEYFWDEEDLEKLQQNCWSCDFCIDAKKMWTGEIQDIVPLSVFGIVLDSIKEYDEKYWVGVFTKLLAWSNEKSLLDKFLDQSDFFWALEDYNTALIKAIIEALLEWTFLEKTDWQYPLLRLTQLWEKALYNEEKVMKENKKLQYFIHKRYVVSKSSKASKGSTKSTKKAKKGSTYTETLERFQAWDSLAEIAKKREIKLQTVESHIIKLYLDWSIWLAEIMKLVDFSQLKYIKQTLDAHFSNWYESLSEIKKQCGEWWTEVSRLEINTANAMIQKGDL